MMLKMLCIIVKKCRSAMQNERRKAKAGVSAPVLRCPVKGCQTMKSVRTGNAFPIT